MTDEEKKTEEKKEDKKSSSTSSVVYYVLGALIVAGVLAGAYFLRPQIAGTSMKKDEGTPAATTTSAPAAFTTPKKQTGPITKLACDSQYYNPVVGFPKYYLSVDGVDVPGAESVDCTFSVSVKGQVVATESATSSLEDEASRGGKKFRCTTKDMALEKNVATKVDVSLKDDTGATAKCSYTFLFP